MAIVTGAHLAAGLPVTLAPFTARVIADLRTVRQVPRCELGRQRRIDTSVRRGTIWQVTSTPVACSSCVTSRAAAPRS